MLAGLDEDEYDKIGEKYGSLIGSILSNYTDFKNYFDKATRKSFEKPDGFVAHVKHCMDCCESRSVRQKWIR